ncbi:MAG TPA: aminotransferase class V-fold PLP-dependent enzyme [Candidatus Absconditabacterales bacterium]|nr:aminotransferase class V-fold PLP-dependent enzyme [Candidatus Absconditabacterales bacterium]
MFKKDFPIFENNPGLLFLDNAASTQKPQYVIDGVSEFVASSYANIHRGLYSLSEKSEEAYHHSKELVAELINCKASEIIYSYNSTYGINLIAQSLVVSDIITNGDTVLLGIREHHANILPRQILAERKGFNIEFFTITDDYEIDRNDFDQKYTDKVKVVSVSQVSNVTGKIYDVKKIQSKLREDTFFLVDGSQSVPNFPVDVQDIGCDCLVFTGHKMMAYTGIGVVYLKKEWIRKLVPMIRGGGTIEDVSTEGHILATNVDKFEAGTPNIIGAVSLAKAIEYIKSIGGMEKIWEHEQNLVKLCLEGFAKLQDKVEILGPLDSDRVAVFSFILPNNTNFNNIGETFAEQNIAIRCGGHCAYPLHKRFNKSGTCRMSGYIYNDEADIDKFFELVRRIV